MKDSIKLQDTSAYVGANSRLEQYWQEQGFEKFYKRWRKGVDKMVDFRKVSDLERTLKTFHLNSIGFGNWLTQEDRFNYLSALIVAMHDLNKIVRFDNNIGLNKTISISFGARGKGSASAHFEPKTFIINVTRYQDASDRFTKQHNFQFTGGAGALAHEYGHALDYYFAIHSEPLKGLPALSGGRSVNRRGIYEQGKIGSIMAQLLDAIIWEKPYTVLSKYYKRLEAHQESDYWFRRTEIFARWFEAYVNWKLSVQGIRNGFLTDYKYDKAVYPTASEVAHVAPIFDRLIAAMRKAL